MNILLVIQHGETGYIPLVEDGIIYSTQRAGAAGQLDFTVVKEGSLNFAEGDAVGLVIDGINVFRGFVFSKRRGKGTTISVTAYDQLRYLKNKDSYLFVNSTATEIIKKIGGDFQLKLGTIENTKYVMPSRTEDNSALLDMIQSALKLTLDNTNESYVLFDDFGKLTLKNTNKMKVDCLIEEVTGENFDYTSTIDSATYNKIKLIFHHKDDTNTVYPAQDKTSMERWGVLQLYDTLQEGENGAAKAKALLAQHNVKTRTLSVSKVFGDLRVRAGCKLPILLHLGDIKVGSYMVVEKCKHTFSKENHFMDLTLSGNEFQA